MIWAGCDGLAVTSFDDSPLVHHGDPSGEIAHYRHGVGDEQVGQAEVPLQLGEEIDDLGADTDIEGRDRFIAHDELWAQRQGSGYADALALSAGELVRVAAAGGFVEAHGTQEFGNAGPQAELRSTGQPRAAVRI